MVAQRILHLGSPASSFPLIEAMSYSGPATTLSLCHAAYAAVLYGIHCSVLSDCECPCHRERLLCIS